MSKLQKRTGHLVSPENNRLVLWKENYPKEANDVQSQYSTLFPLSKSPNCEAMGFGKCRKGLDRSRARQTIPPHLPSLRKQGDKGPQPGTTIVSGPQLRLGQGLDPMPLPQDPLPQISTPSHREPRSLRPLPPSDQKTGSLYSRTLQGHDPSGSGPPSGAELENGQSDRPEVSGETVCSDRLPGTPHPGDRRDIHPKRPSLPHGASGLGGKRPQSSDLEEILLRHEPRAKAGPGGHGDGYVGPFYPGRPTENRLRPVSWGGPIQPCHRQSEKYRKASKANKEVFKGTKYFLLKNRSRIRRPKDRKHLEELLKLNKGINAVLTYRSRTWANKTIDEWDALARALGHPEVTKFAKMLCRYRYGILNPCDYPIHTGILEEVNNKIKVIKRKAYGYHDFRSFSLKIIQAFSN